MIFNRFSMILIICIVFLACAQKKEQLSEVNHESLNNVCPNYYNSIYYEKLGITIKITNPPVSMNMHPFYQKYTDADGIPIISSCKVDDRAFCVAYDIVIHMLSKIPQVKMFMVEYGARVAIMAVTEITTDIPEHSLWHHKNWARGLGGTLNEPLTTCGEENLLQFTNDIYWGESILIHEFGHTIHMVGFAGTDPEFDFKLEQIYREAIGNGLWLDTYAGSNHEEYWAEGVQSWFNLNQVSQLGIETRIGLRNYDHRLFNLLEIYFLDDNWSPYPVSRW